jgi:hypothetical protein
MGSHLSFGKLCLLVPTDDRAVQEDSRGDGGEEVAGYKENIDKGPV